MYKCKFCGHELEKTSGGFYWCESCVRMYIPSVIETKNPPK